MIEDLDVRSSRLLKLHILWLAMCCLFLIFIFNIKFKCCFVFLHKKFFLINSVITVLYNFALKNIIKY